MASRAEAMRALRRGLVTLVWPEHQALQHGLVYRGPAEFVLREGREFRAVPLPPGVSRGAPNKCFANAILAAVIYGFRYAEGYVSHARLVAHDRVGPIHHAWNVDKRGRAVDLTLPDWLPPRERAYLGVELAAARAHEAMWHGDASALDDFKRLWPLLRETWAGEESPGPLDGLAEEIAADYGREDGPERAAALLAQIKRARRSYVP